jgi:energy-coupling factor transporter ATP-binding protein EcfA2
VLLYCVNRGDVAWLHGSAVRIETSAVGFLGPSGAGKSTLALALARAGANHICDDTLPVEVGSPPMVWPSDHVIRLRSDSRQNLALNAHAIRREFDGKFVLTQGATADGNATNSHNAGTNGVPLRALYVLNPVTPGRIRSAAPDVERRLVAPRAALPKLMQHIKLGPLIRPGDPAHYMQQLGAIVLSVPVYELRVTRDWSRIEQVIMELLEWHSGPALANGSVANRRVTV